MSEAAAPPISDELREKRERVFLVLAGLFLCAMTMLNIIGITRFIQLGPMALAVGVLPYPLTFLCTDLISELYGRSRANFMVTVGLILNFFIIGVMWLAQAMPSVGPENQPPWQLIQLAEDVALPNGSAVTDQVELFTLLYATTSGAVMASMMAYIAAQYCDVYMFHFWKKLTNGKHLWLRNNGSTLVSQGVDSFMVITVTFGAQFLAGAMSAGAMLVLMGSNYLFKLCVALADTLPFYIGVHYLAKYLELSEEELRAHAD
ncbi:MAG: queuosine precursor transporter [Pseudomonadales bacterium]|nr:queuosine precursor transporter [Pseudomonadales bacterium]MBO6566699.1 queuosine precursor transporter [Pseudomonadales bacterium]MBO6595863.1 queuosine precursor transporter [Pseudomonadales bacterium]MBO6702468.1 queuosine precursor transporter [Pseudomonadales bacterium]MBO6822347.1 queuosine precursor transporter [Pseudomonadales bacterium]